MLAAHDFSSHIECDRLSSKSACASNTDCVWSEEETGECKLNPIIIVREFMSDGPEDGFMGVMMKLGTTCGKLSSSASACGENTDCQWEVDENKCGPSAAAIVASLTPEQLQASLRVSACDKLSMSNCGSNADCALKE